MTGIDCVSFLALIQLIVGFDFGLFYLDEKHYLVDSFKAYRRSLRLSVRGLLAAAENAIIKSYSSDNKWCILTSAYLSASYNKIKNLTDEGNTNFDGWAFLGLFGGIYGLICMFFVGLFHCKSEYFAQTFILVSAQLVALVEFIIILRLCFGVSQALQRNIFYSTRLILAVLVVAWVLSYFDLTFKCLPNFELPFIISIIVIAIPIVVFVVYHLWCRVRILINTLICMLCIWLINRCFN